MLSDYGTITVSSSSKVVCEYDGVCEVMSVGVVETKERRRTGGVVSLIFISRISRGLCRLWRVFLLSNIGCVYLCY